MMRVTLLSLNNVHDASSENMSYSDDSQPAKSPEVFKEFVAKYPKFAEAHQHIGQAVEATLLRPQDDRIDQNRDQCWRRARNGDAQPCAPCNETRIVRQRD